MVHRVVAGLQVLAQDEREGGVGLRVAVVVDVDLVDRAGVEIPAANVVSRSGRVLNSSA
jgi:hypothetical protein